MEIAQKFRQALQKHQQYGHGDQGLEMVDRLAPGRRGKLAQLPGFHGIERRGVEKAGEKGEGKGIRQAVDHGPDPGAEARGENVHAHLDFLQDGAGPGVDHVHAENHHAQFRPPESGGVETIAHDHVVKHHARQRDDQPHGRVADGRVQGVDPADQSGQHDRPPLWECASFGFPPSACPVAGRRTA